MVDQNRNYKARKIKGFLKTGETEVLIINTMSKPKNDVTLMVMLRKMLGIPEERFVEYNMDDDFLKREPDILVGVESCQVFHQELQDKGFLNDYLHPRLQLMQTANGEGYPFQGVTGGVLADFECSVKIIRKQLILKTETHKKIEQEGVDFGISEMGEDVLRIRLV